MRNIMRMHQRTRCELGVRVSAPTVIPVCDHWNRSKTDVLSPQDGRTRIQGQTNISSATAADNNGISKGRTNVLSLVDCSKLLCACAKTSKTYVMFVTFCESLKSNFDQTTLGKIVPN